MLPYTIAKNYRKVDIFMDHLLNSWLILRIQGLSAFNVQAALNPFSKLIGR
jgi:hypothetical protein